MTLYSNRQLLTAKQVLYSLELVSRNMPLAYCSPRPVAEISSWSIWIFPGNMPPAYRPPSKYFRTVTIAHIYAERKKHCIRSELLPVKRTVKKYKFSLVDSHCSVGLFYAAIYILCFSIGVKMPRLR